MKKTRFGIIVALTLALACILATNLCAESKEEKQEDIQKMAQQTLRLASAGDSLAHTSGRAWDPKKSTGSRQKAENRRSAARSSH